jgi:hypothetical protein
VLRNVQCKRSQETKRRKSRQKGIAAENLVVSWRIETAQEKKKKILNLKQEKTPPKNQGLEKPGYRRMKIIGISKMPTSRNSFMNSQAEKIRQYFFPLEKIKAIQVGGAARNVFTVSRTFSESSVLISRVKAGKTGEHGLFCCSVGLVGLGCLFHCVAACEQGSSGVVGISGPGSFGGCSKPCHTSCVPDALFPR